MAKKSSKSRAPKARKGAWFVRVRGSYLPVTTAGWLTYLPFVAYLGFAWYVGLNDTDDYALAVLWILPNFVAAAVVMTWVAKAKS
jgi:hypothetical protein